MPIPALLKRCKLFSLSLERNIESDFAIEKTPISSNCLTTAYDFEIAIRDIFPGEQLTDDYGYLNINTPFYAYDEGLERKVVYPDDLLRYYEDWDKTLGRTFFLIEKILNGIIN